MTNEATITEIPATTDHAAKPAPKKAASKKAAASKKSAPKAKKAAHTEAEPPFNWGEHQDDQVDEFAE